MRLETGQMRMWWTGSVGRLGSREASMNNLLMWLVCGLALICFVVYVVRSVRR